MQGPIMWSGSNGMEAVSQEDDVVSDLERNRTGSKPDVDNIRIIFY